MNRPEDVRNGRGVALGGTRPQGEPTTTEGDPPTESHAGPASSRSDSRVTAALERYLSEIEAGRKPDRAAFLALHPGIAEELGDCLDGLDLVRSAADDLAGTGRYEAPFPTATVLGDFRILREIGRGGMGVVYEAEQRSLGRRVALKVLPFAASLDPRQRQRFQVEAQAAALLHHAHIVPVYGVGTDRGVPFYAMQFIDGRSLAALIEELRDHPRHPGPGRTEGPGAAAGPAPSPPIGPDPTPPRSDAEGPPSSGARSGRRSSSRGRSRDRESHRSAARLGLQAAEALEHAHALGVVHRDIKPGNLLVDEAGALWVTDFGLARIQDAVGPTRTGDLIGTIRYMSPEQAGVIGEVVDHRADLYSLGATLYELLTLRPVFDGQDRRALLRQIALEEPVAPRKVDPTIPKDLETIVLKALSKEPRDRYADASTMADDLRRFLDDRAILARRPNPAERLARWGRRHRPLVATATISLVSCLAIGMLVLWGEHETTVAALAAKEEALEEAERARKEASEALRLSYGMMQGVTVKAMGELAVNDLISPETYSLAIDYFDRLSRIDSADTELMSMCGDAARWAGYLGAARQFLLVSRDLAERGWDPEIAADYRRAIELNERLLSESDHPEFAENLAVALDSFAWWLSWADPSRAVEAEQARMRSIDLWKGLAFRSPAVPGALRNWIESLVRMEDRLREGGREAEAEDLRSGCMATLDDLSRGDPGRRSLAAGGYRILADLAIARDRRPQGFDLLRKSIALNPHDPLTINNLAWALLNAPEMTAEQLREGMELARRAVGMAPRSGAIQNTVAVGLFRSGDLDGAEEAIRTSIRLNQGEVPIDHFLLSMIHHRRGDLEEARRQLDQGLKLIELRGLASADPETVRFRDEAAGLLESESGAERP
ncbi:serine/threonine-protein kinase [Tautonia plasticadhaerens]|uniref:Serine/threonine-protein kinase PknB n=1 Tax=Tautonia plasticadhaerens TaxID=2527974 RepID=A0A518H3M9_9BACT|nr:serine/threonine-protein kinase [Tautonia plasticadhaerens]QDV35423.1 Serine/threonine-protein kinase PknB [Tautonia plasticadhaerens]